MFYKHLLCFPKIYPDHDNKMVIFSGVGVGYLLNGAGVGNNGRRVVPGCSWANWFNTKI